MKNKLIIIGVLVALAAATVLAVRFWSGQEDTWLCQGGEWVAHGKPNSPKPQAACGDSRAANDESAVNKGAMATATAEDQAPAEEPDIKITSPAASSRVTSPLKITGEAKGWYFEASFPVKMVDENGKVLATGQAKAKGDWMTDTFVPFEAELKFNSGGSQEGELVFEKDNPSGRPENAAKFSLPVLLGN